MKLPLDGAEYQHDDEKTQFTSILLEDLFYSLLLLFLLFNFNFYSVHCNLQPDTNSP